MTDGGKEQNVLVIVADCLRADRCPPAGDAGLRFWPALRDRGAVFTQAIASASNTPVCFGSLLTGQYSFTHGIRTIAGPKLAPGTATLQGALRRAGYGTHAFLTGPLLDLFGLEADFDEYEHRDGSRHIHGDWGEQLLARFARGDFHRPWFVLLHLFELHHPRVLREGAAPYRSMAEYDLAWRQLDARLAELAETLPDDTTVVLTADHGEQIGRRADRTPLGLVVRKLRANLGMRRRAVDWRHHGFHVFEELLRIPLCIAGGAGRATIDQPVRQVDIAPTILDLLGVPADAPMAGRSLMPLTRGETLPDVPAYVESGRDDPPRHWHGLRDGRWKYVEHPRWGGNLRPEAALFDIQADPAERRNVIRRHQDVALRMRAELDRIVHESRPAGAPGGGEMNSDEQARLYEQLKSLGYVS